VQLGQIARAPGILVKERHQICLVQSLQPGCSVAYEREVSRVLTRIV
jgi:hypothetical protein